MLLSAWATPHAHATLITSFQVAFQTPTPAAGWSYLWNNSGAIGNPANYTALQPSPGGKYSADGTDNLPGPPPSGFVNFALVGNPLVPGGHPGLGPSDAGSLGIERYAIALYTLPVSDTFAIVNGLVRNLNPNNGGSLDGVNLRVFVNDSSQPVISDATAAGTGSQVTFGANLGQLNAGDRIYVAIGGKGTAISDSFALQYDIVTVPEPAAATLIAIAAAWVLFISKRRTA